MALASIILDPDAVTYTDDEIVGKVNTATDKISRADAVEVVAILESATEKLMSDVEKTKLGGIAEGAEVNDADLAALDPTQNTKLNGIEALAEVNPADLDEVPDSATRLALLDTEKTKLTGIEDDAKDDQTGEEVRDLVVALADADRKIVVTNPVSGEHKVASVEVDADLKLKADYDETPEA